MGKNRKRLAIGKRITDRLHRFTEAIRDRDKIPDRFTCRTIRLKLEPQKYGPERVKETRKMLGASQAIFAEFLGVSLSTVHDWEQGIATPRPIACRLMDEIRRDPKYWLDRLKELSAPVAAG